MSASRSSSAPTPSRPRPESNHTLVSRSPPGAERLTPMVMRARPITEAAVPNANQTMAEWYRPRSVMTLKEYTRGPRVVDLLPQRHAEAILVHHLIDSV